MLFLLIRVMIFSIFFFFKLSFVLLICSLQAILLTDIAPEVEFSYKLSVAFLLVYLSVLVKVDNFSKILEILKSETDWIMY